MTEMRREFRYMVVKMKDAKAYLNELDGEQLDRILNKVAAGRAKDGKAPLECVVVESDWPEYEPTWEAIAARVDAGKQWLLKPQPADSYPCRVCQRGGICGTPNWCKRHLSQGVEGGAA